MIETQDVEDDQIMYVNMCVVGVVVAGQAIATLLHVVVVVVLHRLVEMLDVVVEVLLVKEKEEIIVFLHPLHQKQLKVILSRPHLYLHGINQQHHGVLSKLLSVSHLSRLWLLMTKSK
jgi:hypothetical protein